MRRYRTPEGTYSFEFAGRDLVRVTVRGPNAICPERQVSLNWSAIGDVDVSDADGFLAVFKDALRFAREADEQCDGKLTSISEAAAILGRAAATARAARRKAPQTAESPALFGDAA
jgi:hypothetical protein